MDLTARDVHEKRFHDAWRGYNQEEVDDFLDEVAETLERLNRENEDLRRRVGHLEQAVATSREAEEMLKKTLVSAQQAAEEAIAGAKAKAERLVAEAEERARRADEQTKERASRVEADLKRRNAEAERAHAQRKRELDASIERLQRFEADLKQRLRAFLDHQAAALEQLSERSAQPSRPAAVSAREWKEEEHRSGQAEGEGESRARGLFSRKDG
jgi:cell division initiation protein